MEKDITMLSDFLDYINANFYTVERDGYTEYRDNVYDVIYDYYELAMKYLNQ